MHDDSSTDNTRVLPLTLQDAQILLRLVGGKKKHYTLSEGELSPLIHQGAKPEGGDPQYVFFLMNAKNDAMSLLINDDGSAKTAGILRNIGEAHHTDKSIDTRGKTSIVISPNMRYAVQNKEAWKWNDLSNDMILHGVPLLELNGSFKDFLTCDGKRFYFPRVHEKYSANEDWKGKLSTLKKASAASLPVKISIGPDNLNVEEAHILHKGEPTAWLEKGETYDGNINLALDAKKGYIRLTDVTRRSPAKPRETIEGHISIAKNLIFTNKNGASGI
jgi:hypothetical protein